MPHRFRTTRVDDIHRRVCAAGLVALAVAAGAQAVTAEVLSVPAEFVRYLSPPGLNDHFERPSAIHVDLAHDEVLIADSGANRVVIFDADGHYRYEFRLGDRMATPLDLAVDPAGFIYVVGSTRQGRRVFQYDFDGLYLSELDLPEHDGTPIAVEGIEVTDDGRLVLLDGDSLTVFVCATTGELVDRFALAPGDSRDQRREHVVGAIDSAGDRLYVPFSNLGTVRVYSLAGEMLASYGHKGNNVGQLNFPVAVAASGDLVAILDKHRFNVVCFDADGRFRGEFGGKGLSPGWFYHPSLLGAGPDGLVYVGQIFEDRVQICRIPAFILSTRRAPDASDAASRGG